MRNQDEIGLLADAIDSMEDQVDHYVRDITRITAERERIAAELSLAEDIQTAMLPHLFPPFPDRKEFELYAVMDPAREVGGDFYDFFLVDDDHLCLVIADVSGKGVPAALFMTMSKTIIQNCGKLGKSPSEILAIANDILCADNQIEMFVTVWIGILEISTGQMVAANAGHDSPRYHGNTRLLLWLRNTEYDSCGRPSSTVIYSFPSHIWLFTDRCGILFSIAYGTSPPIRGTSYSLRLGYAEPPPSKREA